MNKFESLRQKTTKDKLRFFVAGVIGSASLLGIAHFGDQSESLHSQATFYQKGANEIREYQTQILANSDLRNNPTDKMMTGVIDALQVNANDLATEANENNANVIFIAILGTAATLGIGFDGRKYHTSYESINNLNKSSQA